MRPSPLACLAALSLGGAACSSASSPSTGDPFPLTVMGDEGTLRVALTSPSAPVVGTDTVELAVTRASDGSAADGLSVSVVPWMPSMDHGTSSPTVTAEGGGRYLVTDLYLFMPGTWELKITLTGALSDHVEPAFDLQ